MTEVIIPNFHFIRKVAELPQVPACVVNIFVENDTDALAYAQRTGHEIYWIAERNMAVWFTPLRRSGDMK